MAVELPQLDSSRIHANTIIAWLEAQDQVEIPGLTERIFNDLIRNASRPRHATTDACTKLCGYVQLCAKSSDATIQAWAQNEDVLFRLLDFYLEWNEKDSHRSMRLVLDATCELLLLTPEDIANQSRIERLLGILLSITFRRSSRPQVKSAVSALSYYIAKSVVSKQDFEVIYRRITSESLEKLDRQLWDDVVSCLLEYMRLHHVAPAAGKLLVSIFAGVPRSIKSQRRPIWLPTDPQVVQKWLVAGLQKDGGILEPLKNYLFIPLFKSNRDLSVRFLGHLNSYDESTGRDTVPLMRLAALEVGKKAGLVDDSSSHFQGAKAKIDSVSLDQAMVSKFLSHDAANVRSSAFSLIVTSSSSSKPFPPAVLTIVRQCLPPFHNDIDAKFRNEILGLTRNMTRRVLDAIALLRRECARFHVGSTNIKVNHSSQQKPKDLLSLHEGFLIWYLGFLRSELIPTASYQRHFAALQSLRNMIIVLDGRPDSALSDVAAFPDCLHTESKWIRPLLDLTMDPFDDVRDLAMTLLRPSHVLDKQPSDTDIGQYLLHHALQASQLAFSTGRADHADGTARCQGLLCAWEHTNSSRLGLLSASITKLEENVDRARRDLAWAVVHMPVHGDFAALRYIWLELIPHRYNEDEAGFLSALQHRIIQVSQNIWAAVRHILCDDSPEGNIPEEYDDVEGLETRGLLSYSFRAIIESSNLLRSLIPQVDETRKIQAEMPKLSLENFQEIAGLTFEQLATLRHRGAFSTVSLTFKACCQCSYASTSRADETTGVSLLETWYKDAISCIYAQRSTTRRSAGIPALITGILASHARQPSFEDVMGKLQELAAMAPDRGFIDEAKLPQVHAFNCLKEIFKLSFLNKKAERFLPSCLELATTSLKSPVWAIRNCALILLRSLLDLLFGTGENKASLEAGWDGQTLRISYERYPSLPPILLSLLELGPEALEADIQGFAAESVFPALDIIRRAGPPDSHRTELHSRIAAYLGSPQWHIREMAARALCAFLLSMDWLTEVEALLRQGNCGTNQTHGVLLVVTILVERLLNAREDHVEELASLGRLLRDFAAAQPSSLRCSENTASYIKLCGLIVDFQPPETAMIGTTQDYLGKGRSISAQISTPWALLDGRDAVVRVIRAARTGDFALLERDLSSAVAKDADTAHTMLEAVPKYWQSKSDPRLCELYMAAYNSNTTSGVKALALESLSELLDDCIIDGDIEKIPSTIDIGMLQPINAVDLSPSLANATILVSGPLLALQIFRQDAKTASPELSARVRCWGSMMASALHEDNTFDMRIAAASSLRSFAITTKNTPPTSPYNLPFLLAIYNALIDDDDEVRGVAAAAAAAIINGPVLVPINATDALLAWLVEHKESLGAELRAYACLRLAGRLFTIADASLVMDARALEKLIPESNAAAEMAEVLHFDDALFAVEEQNLFVDEVLEARRWSRVFCALYSGTATSAAIDEDDSGIKDDALVVLRRYTISLLQVLVKQAAVHDGSLGWTAQPKAFALCARVLICARALCEVYGPRDEDGEGEEGEIGTIRRLLEEVQRVGAEAEMHEMLLAIGRGDDGAYV